MAKTRFVIFLFMCVFVLVLGVNEGYAAEQKSQTGGKVAEPAPDTPAKTTQRQTQISVNHTGNDNAGTRLATRLKELFNGSNLFALNESNSPKIRILLVSKAEFSDRPNVGSVYSIIWVFSQSEGHLGYLLAQEVDVLTPEDVDRVAAKLLERTDGLAVKYAYLFK